jgi:putative oxidoreductase
MTRLIASLIRLCEQFPYALLALLGRFAMARTFFDSGQTKLAGEARCVLGRFCAKINPFTLSDSAETLFQEEYHMPFPWFMAHAAALAEFTFSILLLVGLASRLSALGLLGMTLVIEIFVYPGAYVLHASWATILLMIMTLGPGAIALDRFFARR